MQKIDASVTASGWVEDPDNDARKFKVLYESEHEKVSVEQWAANEEVEIEIPSNGKEIFVVSGSFATWENDVYATNSFTRFTEEGDKNFISGNNGCYVYIKEGVGRKLKSKL